MQKFFKQFHIRALLRACVYVLIFCIAYHVDAATLYLNPSSAQLSVGETVKVRVLVNTKGSSVNAVEGLIKYDPTTVDVTAVSKINSILNIWIEEPVISAAGGTISFNGGAINPGYTGSAGEIFHFTVRAKKTGVVQLTFSDATVRASDGEGTDVLTAETGTTVSVGKSAATTPEPVKKPAPKPVAEIVPKTAIKLVAPTLSSPTHPDPETWYSLRSADVVWSKNINAAGVQIVFNSIPNTIATGPVQYGVTKKMLRGVRDGISYLHVRYVGQNSTSETAHYAIRVDTVNPTDVSIATTSVQGVTKLEILAKDIHSGIAYADVGLDGGELQKVDVVEGRLVYKPDVSISTGNHLVRAVVFDKAGNSTELQNVVWIDAPKVEVATPVIESVPVVEEKVSWFKLVYDWVTQNPALLALISATLMLVAMLIFAIDCVRKKKRYRRDVTVLEKEAVQSIESLKEEAYRQIVYLERIAQLRDLTPAEKDMYSKCRALLN